MLIYTFAIRFYHLLAKVLSPFNKKAKQFSEGRKNIFDTIEKQLANNKQSLIWMHCASLGEFEQGRPVIEKLKKQFPNRKIVLTFFSPSGYEMRKDYEFADFVFYLPMDTKYNARRFIKLVKPSLAIFVKYEFWLNYLNELHYSGTPTLLISGIFRKEQHFFKWYGGIFKRTLFHYKHIFLQNQESLKLLHELGINECSIAGDTRFDRVMEIALQPKQFDEIKRISINKLTILCGSTWAEDEKYLLHSFKLLKQSNPNACLIIAPHNIERININQLVSIIKSNTPNLSYAVYTQWDRQAVTDILIVDTMGMLSSLYQYAQVAYIGGGFGSGIHNILEALVYGIPVIFGPNYRKFNEAVETLKLGISNTFQNQEELNSFFVKINESPQILKEIKEKSNAYIQGNSGSSDKIIQFVEQRIFKD